MTEAYAHIQMLSSGPVREAAEAYYRISFDARFGELEPTGIVSLKDRATYVYPARDAFVEAARTELGISTEALT